MAKILDYIGKQIVNLNKTIDSNSLLKDEGMFITAKYISRETGFIYGNSVKYVKDTAFSQKSKIDATYGVNVIYWKELKKIADTKGKDKSNYFISKILTPDGKENKDVKAFFEKLYRKPSSLYNKLVDALANLINYQVMNVVFQNQSIKMYDKIYTNINYSSLPNGVINSIQTTDFNFLKDYPFIDKTSMERIMKNLCPQNLNLDEVSLEETSKFFIAVVNKDLNSIKLNYKRNRAEGYIVNDNITIDLPEDYICTPLSISTEVDKSYFNGSYSLESIDSSSTKFNFSPLSNVSKCSPEDLEKISSKAEFVSNLSENDDFIKLAGVKGKDILKNVEPFNILSRNFYETYWSDAPALSQSNNGFKAISIKLFFDKINEVFMSLRSNDMYFALYCATYNDNIADTIDIYFNPKSNDVYFVNSNKEQYGYCKGVSTSFLSNCEHIVYAELYKPSLSIQQKSKIFEEQNIRAIELSDKIIDESDALQDALIRQSKLIDIKDSDLFYNLFINNIASFIYTYAEQVYVNNKLLWRNKANPKWSLDSNEGNYNKGKWSNPDHFYIYDIRETFWMNNQEMTIEEVLAYFVCKGGSSKDNSSNFRKLSQRILGVDYFMFSEQLFPTLIEKGLICIEKLKFAKDSGQIIEKKYTYSYEYASGDVYKKLDILNRELEDNIIKYYGETKGTKIIDKQNALLNNAKPKKLSFGDKDPALNLIVNIHNPIFFNNKESYLGRIGEDYNVFRDGKVRLSTIENEVNTKYKKIELGGLSKEEAYNNFIIDNPLNLSKNHLKKFYEFIVYGQAVDFITNPILKQNEFYLIDGYIFPIKSSKFIKKYILPKFEKITDEGNNIPCPLEFISSLAPNQKTFTLTNVYKEKNEKYQYSNLTQQSRQNLINIGLVEDKPKKEVEIKIIDLTKKTGYYLEKQMFTPISEAEGKVIYNIITDKYKKLESLIKNEGNNLFTTFCKVQLTPKYRIFVEEEWNKTYNNMGIPVYSKFPIFCEHSRWFGSLPKPFLFSLREAQVEGMKFAISNKNSGLLAHEVGFGKTTTSIAMISHMILTGESSRTIVFTPNQVYEKFADEIIGRDTTGTLGLLSNWQVLEKNKRDNIKDSINVIKFGNASANILKGTGEVKGLKIYTEDELDIMNKWKGKAKPKKEDNRSDSEIGATEMAINQLKNLPASRPTFLPEDKIGNQNESRFSNSLRQSDYYEWYDKFYIDLGFKIPELFGEGNIDDEENLIPLEAVDKVLMKIENSAKNIYDKVNSEYERFKSGYRYQKQDFTNDNKSKIPSYPKSVQDWWKSLGKNPSDDNIKKYPQKGWVSNVDDALKDGVINKSQYDRIKIQQQPWEGVLSQKGIQDIKKLENKEAILFFNPIENKYTGEITRLLKSIENMLIDILGRYREEVLYPNKIVLCNHQAINKFRADLNANIKARMYVQNVENKNYVNETTNRSYDNLLNQPLSLRNLNVDGICVDEIHNFNNLVSKPREHSLSLIDTKIKSVGKEFHLLPTINSSASLDILPDRTTINTNKGLSIDEGTPYHNNEDIKKLSLKYSESAYRLKYSSNGKSSKTVAPNNLLALVFEIQSKEENKELNNTILMSATPFTDNVFQMFSVFGMTNLDKMKESNISSVWDFFVTFVQEEWRYNITHTQKFGLFPKIQSYYNTGAMSNFIKSMANFKVSDKIIEADRPLKYYIPQDGTGGNKQAGANTSTVQWAKELQDVSSYIPLNSIQREILNKVSQYVEGKIDIPFQYCPNYGEAIKVDEKTGVIEFVNEEVGDSMKKVRNLIDEAKKVEGTNEAEENFREARAILVDLRILYPDDKVISTNQRLVDKALYSPDELDDEEKDNLYDSNYEYIDLLANNKNEKRMARAIVGQSFGQMCVISPYLLKCDTEGETPNDLLKEFPLYPGPDGLSKSAINFVENSPKIKYAIECALNTIKFDSKKGGINDRQVGGQIIYINKGKNMKYGGFHYNVYKLIERYIVDRKITYFDNITNKESILSSDNIGIITGGMTGEVEQKGQDGKVIFNKETNKPKKIGIREDIRDKFNDGRIKILIGSSAIKEGIDLNKRAHTLYVLDSDFSPSNAMQLEGRIWRQKNMWKYVRIVYVLGIDSIDAFVYSKLQTKIGEIKEMLEAGVYELNKTQFTIDAKERIRNIITDVDQLTDLAWQDKVDELNEKIGKYTDEKSKLETIKLKYGEVKESFEKYYDLMNKLYELVIFNEKIKLAEIEKNKLDIEIDYKYKIDSLGRGRLWKENNKPILTDINEAIKIVEKQEKEGVIEFTNANLILNSDSDMTIINRVGDAVRRMIQDQRGTIKNIFEYESSDRVRALRNINSSSILGLKALKIIFENNAKSGQAEQNLNYDSILNKVNQFLTGTEYERIMSNYCYLVKNQTKNEMTSEKYSYKDIDILITKAQNKVIEGQNELNSEKKWKMENRIKEEESQIMKSKLRGDRLETLIEKFNNSMPLLEIRVEEKTK